MVKGKTLFLILAGVAAGIGSMVATYLRTPFDEIFEELGKRYKIDSNLLRAIARHESGMNPNAISKPNKNGTRDYGLMQINETTAKKFGVTDKARLMDPRVSIEIACKLIVALRSELKDKLNLFTLIAAYNAGSPSVIRGTNTNGAYVASVRGHHELYSMARAFA